MKFFLLTHAFEKKDVGKFPGLKDCIFNGQRFANDSFDSQGRDSKVIGNPALPFPEMFRSVKMTDWIEIIVISSIIYPVISERFLNFLKPHIQGNYQTWKIDVKKGDVIYDYYILHIDNPKTDFVDYTKSVFKLFKNKPLFQYEDLNQEIKIKNDKEYFETITKYTPLKIDSVSLKATKITFNTSKNTVDFFRCISTGYFGYFVSEKLKIEIEKQGFTGMIYKELDNINNFVQTEII